MVETCFHGPGGRDEKLTESRYVSRQFIGKRGERRGVKERGEKRGQREERGAEREGGGNAGRGEE